jgi:hypothetical protein
VIEVNPEDQYAVVSGDVTLAALEAALPEGLHYRTPGVELTVEDWLLSGGVGLLNAPPTRRDVLGLTYKGAHGSVSIGGVVVKNVSGYDLRLVVGSDPSLQKTVRVERAVLRLRPSPTVTRFELTCEEAELPARWLELRQLGAAYGFAYQTKEVWRLRAEFWGDAPAWGTPVNGAVPAARMRDALGDFPRAWLDLSDFERRVLAAL